MIINLKPYLAYKDSGVEWLGEVPAHWEVRRLKSAVAHINQQTNVKRPNDLYIALEHVESWTGRLRAPSGDIQFDSQVKRFRAGDVLFGKLRPYLAKVARPTGDGVCVGEFFVLRSGPAVKAEYLELALRSPAVIEYVNSSTFGARMPRAEWAFVGSMLFPIPPLPEQTAIVRFLDWAEGRIRRVIQARQRRIKLLEEYKQALIHRAVTGQIDVRTGQPYPAYKDSGVEWLGQVPEHWEVAGLRYVTSCLDGRRVPLNAVERGSMPGPYPYWGANKIIDYINDYLFDEPLVLLGEDGAPFFETNKEVAFFVEGKIWVNNHAHVIRCKGRVQPRYLVYVLNLTDYTRFVDGSTRDKLTQQAMGSIPVILPRLEEQTAIVEYLNAQTAKIDAAIAAARREIERLREYRTRLIADVVTGKVDVREVAARLPEEPSEEDAPWTDEEERAQDETLNGEGDHAAISEEDG